MGQKIQDTAHTDRIGVGLVSTMVHQKLRWLFREQPTLDFGIDAQIEIIMGGEVTGRLVAAQIKSGESWFKAAPDGWWFYPEADHLQYWLEHSLPVIVVFCNIDTGKAYWESVERDRVLQGPKGGKRILIKEAKELTEASKEELAELSAGSDYDLRIRRLRLALPWMRLLSNGRRVLLEAEEWINKSSGRGDLSIVSVDATNEDRDELGKWMITAGLREYESLLPTLVPWANAVIHEETYEEADYDAWQSECVRYVDGYFRFESESYEDWSKQFDDLRLRPYRNGAGEVDFWRLELVLNDLGRAFLKIDEFAEGYMPFLVPGK